MGYNLQPLQPAQADRQDQRSSAWCRSGTSASTIDWGEQAQPLVYDGVMYVTNAKATVAIDVATGKQIWKHAGRLAAGDAARRVLRRLQQGRGDLQRQALPHHARRPRRRARHEDRQGDLERRRRPSGRKAIRMTVAPLIANGVLITGISGAEFGIRGFHRRLGSGNRQAAVAPLHHSGARRDRATRPGRRTTTPGRPAAARAGSPAPTIPSST